MMTAGRPEVRMGGDGWAIFSQDGSPAAHFEFTVAITAEGPRVLTPWHLPREGKGEPAVEEVARTG
jgi:methionyl aminopeptidase